MSKEILQPLQEPEGQPAKGGRNGPELRPPVGAMPPPEVRPSPESARFHSAFFDEHLAPPAAQGPEHTFSEVQAEPPLRQILGEPLKGNINQPELHPPQSESFPNTPLSEAISGVQDRAMLYTKAFAVLEQERQELLAIPDKKASQIDRINELDRMIWEYFYRIEGLREAWGIMEASRGNIDINSVIEVILSFGRDDHNSSGHFF